MVGRSMDKSFLLRSIFSLTLFAANACVSGCSRPTVQSAPGQISVPVASTVQPTPELVAAKNLHGLQLAQSWSPEAKAAQIQFAYVYLVEGPEKLGSEVDAARGRVNFLTYKLCLLSPPTEVANQAKCDKLIDRFEDEGNKLPKW